MLITSCSCFPFGMYTVISSVPCPVLSEISSSGLRMRYILTESCFRSKDLKTFLYRCDDHFHVDILKDMLKDDNLIGFLP